MRAAGATSDAPTASAPSPKAAGASSRREGAGPEQDRRRDQERPERLGHHEGLLAREPRVQGEEGQARRALPRGSRRRAASQTKASVRTERSELHAEDDSPRREPTQPTRRMKSG